jgi:hypothetical protein
MNVEPSLEQRPRIGTLPWTTATQGCLSAAERQEFLTARPEHSQAIRPAAPDLEVKGLTAPDSDLARHTERLHALLPPVLARHGQRAWALGLLLSRVDGQMLNPEVFYVASLLHDAGLARPKPGRCFTLTGADLAFAAGRASGSGRLVAESVAEAITLHVNLGLNAERDTEPYYIQAGSMADLTAARLAELPRGTLEQLVARYPRNQARTGIADRWRAETRAVPSGRAAAIEQVFLSMIGEARLPD